MSLLRRSATLALGEGAARAFGVAIYIIIARVLGVAEFGVFSFAMGAALLAAVAIDMGQNAHLGRTVSLKGTEHAHIYTRMTLNKLMVGTTIMVLSAAGMTLAGAPSQTVYATVLMIGWSTGLGVVEGMRALMRALDRMNVDSIINGTESAGRLLAVLVAAWLGAGVVGFSLAFFAEAAVAALVTVFLAFRRLRLRPTSEEWASTGRFGRDALALGLVGIATAGFYRIDQVFVLPLAGAEASGLYGAAARVVFTCTVVAGLITQAAYPGLAAAAEDRVEFGARFRRALAFAVSAAALVTVLILVFADVIVMVFYGRQYSDAAMLMRVLAGVILFNSVTAVSMFGANSLHLERQVLPRIVLLALATVAANVLLIPAFGAVACAWISVVGEVLLAGSILWLMRDRLVRGSHERTGQQR